MRRIAGLSLLALSLAGCDGGPSPEDEDGDGDGWTTTSGDCDDGDPSVHPGAVEGVSDGKDQDCDGGDDCYLDADRDGFGSTLVVASLDIDCQDPGESQVPTDCDDAEGGVHPEADETVADGVDQDCDGLEDCWVDGDGDGWGRRETVASDDLDCSDAGEAPNGMDCDDVDPAVNPGGEEVCEDRVDNDCDELDARCGLWGDIALASAAVRLASEAAKARVGLSVALGDVDGDGLKDLVTGGDGAIFNGGLVGAAWVVFSPAEGRVDVAGADAILLAVDAGEGAGTSVAVEDMDDDGVSDVLVGAPRLGTLGLDPGVVFLVHAPVAGTVSLEDADALVQGETARDGAGWAMVAGDMTGDGVPDLLVGAPWADEGGDDAGAAYLVHGPVTGEVSLTWAEARLVGENSEEISGMRAGMSVTTGDTDADGETDFLVGAPYAFVPEMEAGLLCVVLGPVAGFTRLADAEATIAGEEHMSMVGWSARAHDMDGDGHDDVLVGAYRVDAGADASGAVYLFLGPVEGWTEVSEADATLGGDCTYGQAGIVDVADVDGDGAQDVLVGAPGTDVDDVPTGAVHLVYGPIEGIMPLGDNETRFVGEKDGDEAGASVTAGDVDGDGQDDVFIGAPGQSDGGPSAGAAYLVFGLPS